MNFKHSVQEKFQLVTESFTDNVSRAGLCERHVIYPVQLIRWREEQFMEV